MNEQVKTQKAEETIKQHNLDMVDLRQAAGPTADLIQKLKDEAAEAKEVKEKEDSDTTLFKLEEKKNMLQVTLHIMHRM